MTLLGEIKEEIKYAWFPVLIKNRWIWLTDYVEIWEFKTFYFPNIEGTFIWDQGISKITNWKLIKRKLNHGNKT